MKNSVIKLFLLSIFALMLNNKLAGQNLMQTNSEILGETNQYIKRVNLDDGKMLDKNYLNKFIHIAKKDNWFSQINFWTSAQWGIKESDGNISLQYELNGKDLTTEGFDKRPKAVVDGNILGIKYDGLKTYSNNSDVTAQHPMSMLLVFKVNESLDNNILLESKGNTKNLISLEKNNDGKTQLVIRTAGEIFVTGVKPGINILYIEFNIKNSRVFINGEMVYNGVIGKSMIDGLVIGKGNYKNHTGYFDGTMYETGIINNLINDEARTDIINLMKQVYNVN
jgi:hypothetical protein